VLDEVSETRGAGRIGGGSGSIGDDVRDNGRTMIRDDDDLEAEERREFDRHLAVCPSCVAYLDTFRTTVELGRHAFDEGRSAASPALDAPPPPLPEDLVAAILAVRG
jgi:hypothetical protein